MARGGKVRVDITADASGVRRGVDDAERSLSRLNRAGSRSLKALGAAAIGATAAAGTGLAAGLALGTRELLAQEKASARTRNVIETTGGAANVTAKAVENLASALQRQTGSADDAIQSAANLLLTFTKVRNEAGKGNDVFNQGVAIANDMSVAMGTDMNAAAIQVGKALNDPIKGVTALQRVGVSFTQQQRDQIKALVESGDTLGAQKLILRELKTEFEGAASSEGKTTEALQQIQRRGEDLAESMAAKVLPVVVRVAEWIQRHWPEIERVTERVFEGARAAVEVAIKWIDANVVPTIRSIVAGARAFWRRFGDEITDTFRLAVRIIGGAMKTVKAIIETVLAVIRGDWGKAWSSLKTAVTTAFGTIFAFLKGVPARMLAFGLEIGKAIGGAIKDGLASVKDEVVEFLWGMIPGPIRRFLRGSSDARSQATAEGLAGLGGAGGGIRRAMGGTIPGAPGQAVPIIAHAGEVVLNPAQQRIVGIDRIMRVLAATGGVIGGDGFASGGVVWPQSARDFLSEARAARYSQRRRGERAFMDCSEFASGMAQRFGYTGPLTWTGDAATRYSRPARGDEPIVWGFRGPVQSASGHMGIRIGGTWYDFGGSGLGVGDSRWEFLRVPIGLEGRTIASEAGGGTDTRAATAGRGSRRLSPLQRLERTLGQLGVGSPGSTARRLSSSVPDVSGGLSGTSLTPGEERSAGRAGRTARAAARAAGKSPAEVAAAGEEAERQAEIRFLNKHLGQAREELSNLGFAKRRLLADYRRLGRKKVTTDAARRQKRRLMRQYRARLRQITAEMADVREVIADITERLAEIGEEIAQEKYEASYDDDAGEGAGPSGSEPGQLSADQQAQLDQANQRAETAERGAAISDSVLRTLFTSGSIDPGAGSINVTIQTLHPGDPAIQGEVARWVVGALGGQGSVPTSTFRARV